MRRCRTANAGAAKLKAVGVPMLQVEREEQMANAGQLAIRAEAFVEMIEK